MFPQIFPNIQAAKDYLRANGFDYPADRKMTSRIPLVDTKGRQAFTGMGIIGKTGQSSTGAAWGYTVVIRDMGKMRA